MEMGYITSTLAFVITCVLTIIITPIVSINSVKLNIVSVPGDRHVHTKVTPRMGGLAIYTSFMIGCVIFLKGDRQIMGLLIGGFVMALGGILDDLMELSARSKLLFQLMATIIVIYYGGIEITSINLPLGIHLEFGLLSTVVTFLWIIGITNAVNLIDGLDGLCAGVTSIILATLAMLAYMQGRYDITMLAILLLGSTVGFLFYNFDPASVFMGDTGSLFIGYMIAAISILGFKSSAFLTLGPIIFLLAIPILDIFLSIIRRKIKGVSIATPDREHLHHTLMYKLNLSQVKAVLVIYAMTFYFSQVAYAYLLNKRVALLMLIIIIIVIELFIEATGMISTKYRPILALFDRIKSKFRKKGKSNG